MTLLAIQDLTVRRKRNPVVRSVSLKIGRGEVVGLVGPNGAGKTTLMRGALGLLPFEGQASLAELSPRARAKAAAWLPQTREITWPVSVETLVSLGRTPYLAGGRRLSAEDQRAIDQAIEHMQLEGFADRPATELSGGEQARVLIARVLAQEAPLIIADEPGAGLDPAHQFGLMRVFRDLAARGQSVFVSLHDLGLAAKHCTRLVMLDEGALVADGPPVEVLSDAQLRDVFAIGGHWSQGPEGEYFHVVERV